MQQSLNIIKVLGAVEDLLMDATSPSTVTQTRGGQQVTVTKINMNTIPAEGKYGEVGFKSIAQYLTELIAQGESFFVENAQGEFGIAIGTAGLTWDGGTPASTEMTIVQRLGNGNYRWIAKLAVGSDNIVFRGRVSGDDAINSSDFITKNQLDTAVASLQQTINNVSVPDATTTVKGIVERATTAEVLAGTDTTRYVTPADLSAFSQALPSPTGISIGQGVTILSDADETDRPQHLETVGETLSLGSGVPYFSELDVVALSDSVIHLASVLHYNGSTTNISDPTIRYWIVPLDTEVSGSPTGTSVGSSLSGAVSVDITIPAGHYCHIDGTIKNNLQQVHRAEIYATTIELTSTAGSTAISIPSAQGAHITYGADGGGSTVQVTEPIYLHTQGDSSTLNIGTAVGNSIRWMSALAVSSSTINLLMKTGSPISFVENNNILYGLKYWVVPLGGTITDTNYTGLIPNSGGSGLGGVPTYTKDIVVPSGSILYTTGDNGSITYGTVTLVAV